MPIKFLCLIVLNDIYQNIKYFLLGFNIMYPKEPKINIDDIIGNIKIMVRQLYPLRKNVNQCFIDSQNNYILNETDICLDEIIEAIRTEVSHQGSR